MLPDSEESPANEVSPKDGGHSPTAFNSPLKEGPGSSPGLKIGSCTLLAYLAEVFAIARLTSEQVATRRLFAHMI